MSTPGSIDFHGIAAALLQRSESFLADLFPAGRIRSREFCIGNIQGEAGDSLKINLDTGIGADFASGQTFGDLIDVYAAHHGLTQGEAAKRLSNGAGESYRARAPSKPQSQITRPPPNTPAPTCHHSRHGAPAAVWCYDDATGPLHYVARYNTSSGKEIVPWTWNGSTWNAKGYPKPRPLYGLAAIQAAPDAKVIVVEGEKCVDALRRMQVQRVPVSASGGASGFGHADWSPLAGRDVLLFPDHDAPGRKCMLELAAALVSIAAKLTIIDHEADDLPEGWDIADTTWTAGELNAWARSRIKPVTPPAAAEVTRGRPRSKPDGSPINGELIEHETGSAFVSWASLGLQCNQNGMPHPTLSNCMRIFATHPRMAGRIWYDEFYHRVFSTLFSGTPEEWAEHHDTRLAVWIQDELKLHKMGIQTVQRAVDAHARKHTRNEPKEWFSSLVWDGIERLESVMADGFGAEQNPYTAAVGRCFFVGMVARIFIPGCKHDYMPVFEGSQGTNKSTALDVIGGAWFAEQHEDITTKDFYQNLQGKLLFEISELDAFRRAEVTRIKGVISCRKDRYRGSFDRRAADHPRMCAFAGTTNRDDWVADDTGARRFWPISGPEANIDYLINTRAQLFAEAVSRFNRVPINARPAERIAAGADWWNVDPALAKAEVDMRREPDIWTAPILDYAKVRKWVLAAEILTSVLKIPVGQHARADQMRVASVLKLAGFKRKQKRLTGEPDWCWLNPALQHMPDSSLIDTTKQMYGDSGYKDPFE